MSFQTRRIGGHPTQPEIVSSAHIRGFQSPFPSSQRESARTDEMLKMVQPGHHHGYQPVPPPRPPSVRSTSRRASQFRPPSREKTSYNLYEPGLSQGSHTDDSSRDIYSRASSVSLSRPSSSLSKYNPLPPIGYQSVPQFETDIGDTTELNDSFRKLSLNIHVPSSEEQTEAGTLGGYDKSTGFNRQTAVVQGRRKTTPDIQGKRETTLRKESSSQDKVIPPTRRERREAVNVAEDNLKFATFTPAKSCDGQSRLTIALKLPDGRRFQHCFPATSSLLSVLKYVETESGLDFDGFSLIQNSPKKIFNDLSRTLSDCHLEDRTLLYVDKDD